MLDKEVAVFMTRARFLLAALASAAALLAFGLSFCSRRPAPTPLAEPAPPLAVLVERLSEPGGYFDSDNLISNETAFLQVSDRLKPRVDGGGAYIGVGPDQNFTYIARLRPRWAFILDIRRQNMLEHLLFNAILEKAETPLSYLGWLFSRPPPEAKATEASSEGAVALLAAFESQLPRADVFERNRAAIFEHIEERLRFPLSEEDRAALSSLYQAFFQGQLELRFRSHGRPTMPHHPTFRELLSSKSPSGQRGHFLTSPADYSYVREMARAGRLVPVVGDFAGPRSLKAIAAFLRERGETVSAFYLSNVEFYLIRSRRFASFVANVKQLPLAEDSLFIRAYFDYGLTHPAGIPGHRSTTLLQRIPRFLALYEAGAYRSYWDVCTVDYLR
jgi:hypothetical protein